MRYTRLTMLFSLLVAVLFVPGCEKKASKIKTEPAMAAPMVASPATQPSATSQPASMTVITASKDYSFAARAAFAADMQRDLDALKRSLNGISVKLEASRDKAEAKAANKAKVAALVKRAALLSSDIDKARNAQLAAWEQVKADIKKSNDDFKASVVIARTWLSEKIAP